MRTKRSLIPDGIELSNPDKQLSNLPPDSGMAPKNSLYQSVCQLCGQRQAVPRRGDFCCRRCGQQHRFEEAGHRLQLTAEQAATLLKLQEQPALYAGVGLDGVVKLWVLDNTGAPRPVERDQWPKILHSFGAAPGELAVVTLREQ